MCFLPLAAAAVTAPRIPLRLLGRGLAAAMSTTEPLKSVDYEVFGRVQGRGTPTVRECKMLWEEGEKAAGSPFDLKDALSRWGWNFRSAMTQQQRVERRRSAHALEGWGGHRRG